MNYYLKVLSVLLFIFFIMVSSPMSEESDKQAVPELAALRINGNAPQLDGNLDDAVWQNTHLDFASNFTQRQQDEGEAATESTLVAVAYDDEALYFAFWAYDSEPDKIDKQLVRRDRHSIADAVSVRLDPYHDHQTGYWFQVSVSGTKRDFVIYNDDNTDISWDANWEAGVKIQPWGWSAEIKIPFHCLRFTEKDVHTWGMNVTRYIPRREESSWWAFAPTSQ